MGHELPTVLLYILPNFGTDIMIEIWTNEILNYSPNEKNK